MTPKRIALAALITLSLFFLSRLTGPNFRYRVSLEGDGFTASHRAPRTSEGTGPASLELTVQGDAARIAAVTLEGQPRQGSGQPDRFSPVTITRQTDGSHVYRFEIPFHPFATKYDYVFRLGLTDGRQLELKKNDAPMTVRFRGEVPAWLLGLHILGMFFGFLIICLSAFAVADFLRSRGDAAPVERFGLWGWIIMLIGGIPLGFLMNRYAFGPIWEGWPFGADVTDNKTQIALVLYGIALLTFNLKKAHRVSGWIIVAATAAVFIVFVIPHSI